MTVQRYELLRLCLVCALAAGFCLEGCRKKEEQTSDDPVSDKPSEPETKRAEYANDLDRVGQLTEKINRACRGSYVVVLGADAVTASGSLVSVDYALFDRLSDDAAAVLIAEAIVASHKSLSQAQEQANSERDILQADEVAGRYIARAGFSSAGFAEWLEARKVLAANLQQNSLPESTRIAAFVRGYSSEPLQKDKVDKSH